MSVMESPMPHPGDGKSTPLLSREEDEVECPAGAVALAELSGGGAMNGPQDPSLRRSACCEWPDPGPELNGVGVDAAHPPPGSSATPDGLRAIAAVARMSMS